MGDIAKDEWGRMVRVTGYRAGYLVCERITEYGDREGGMAMYCHSELRPAKLTKKPGKKKAKKRAARKKNGIGFVTAPPAGRHRTDKAASRTRRGRHSGKTK